MQRGEIWLVGISQRGGHGQHGTRPAVLVTTVASDGMMGIVPLTSNLRATRFARTLIVEPSAQNGLELRSVALVTQSMTIDTDLLHKRLGDLEDKIFKNIIKEIHEFWG